MRESGMISDDISSEDLMEMLENFGMSRKRAKEEVKWYFEFNDIFGRGTVSVTAFAEDYVRRQNQRLISRVRKKFAKLDSDGLRELLRASA